MKIIGFEGPGKEYVAQSLEEDEWIQSILYDLDTAAYYQDERNEIGQRNYDFYASRQWTDGELREHDLTNRMAYVFNEVQHKVDHLIGTQMQTRMDTKILPREKGDEEAARLLTYVMKWLEQVNDIEYIETEVFQEAIIRGCSATVTRWEFDDVEYGYPKIERIPTNELYWDQTAKTLKLEDARWMARVQYLTRLDLLEMFPDKYEIIQRATDQGTYSTFNVPTYKQKNQFRARGSQSQGMELARLIEYYSKYKKYKYTVYDDIEGRKETFDDYKSANEYFTGMVETYTELGYSIVDEQGRSLVAFATGTIDCVRQTLIVGNEIIHDELTSLADFPFTVCFAYHADGDYWAFVDSLISPQLLVNRFFSQWDYIIGTSPKNAMTVMEPLLRRGFSVEALRQELSKTSPIIPVVTHNALSSIPNNPVNPELFQGIMFGIQRMTDYAGGKNVLGQQENAAESGRAVTARAEQGGIARLPLFDKLTLWRKQVTYKFIWWVKNYMAAGQILAVIGSDTDEVKYVDLDDGVLDSLKELKMNIVVDEASKSATTRQSQFMQAKELLQTVQLPPELSMPLLIELSDLPAAKKDKLLEQMQFFQEYTAKKAEMSAQEKLKEQVKNSVSRSEMIEQIRQGDEKANQLKELESTNAKLQQESAKNQALLEKLGSEGLTADKLQAMVNQKRAEEDINNRMRAKLQGG